jgi:hypothetical protein
MIRTEVTRRLRGELTGAVVANELMDRERQRKWICMIEKRAGKQTLTEVQIETKDGPLYRVLAIDGTELNPDQRQQDDARIGRAVSSDLSLSDAKDLLISRILPPRQTP